MKKDRKMVQQALLMVFQLGINMLVPIGLCTIFGVWLGEELDADWVVVPLFFVGALAGYTSVFKMVRNFIDDKDDKGKKKC